MRYGANACEELHRLHAYQQEYIIAVALTISGVLLAVLLW